MHHRFALRWKVFLLFGISSVVWGELSCKKVYSALARRELSVAEVNKSFIDVERILPLSDVERLKSLRSMSTERLWNIGLETAVLGAVARSPKHGIDLLTPARRTLLRVNGRKLTAAIVQLLLERSQNSETAKFIQNPELFQFPNNLHDPLLGIDYDLQHTRMIDALMGLSEKSVRKEAGLLVSDRGSASWSDEHYGVSYLYLQFMMEAVAPKKNALVVDVGCGIGRLGMYVGARFPSLRYIGYEINGNMVSLAQNAKENLGFENAEFKMQDVISKEFEFREGDVFYLFDPVNEESRRPLFEKLRKAAKQHPITVVAVEGTGDFLEAISDQKWLVKTRALTFPEINFDGAVFQSGLAP